MARERERETTLRVQGVAVSLRWAFSRVAKGATGQRSGQHHAPPAAQVFASAAQGVMLGHGTDRQGKILVWLMSGALSPLVPAGDTGARG